jgi:glutamate/tyrosine decarboxylase-like PLP-dependent enzyme
MDGRTILCLQAGNVNTGAFDAAAAICPIARAAGAWIHVDGAFGLWAAASPEYHRFTKGFEQADSWATDAHKWPNIGYDCGIALVREPEQLRAAMSIQASYLSLGEHREPSDYNPELSRRARGVELWAGLRSLGRSGMAEIVERTSSHARRFAAGLRAAGFPGYRRKEPAGADRLSGRGRRPCASASRRGLRPKTMWSGASRRW